MIKLNKVCTDHVLETIAERRLTFAKHLNGHTC